MAKKSVRRVHVSKQCTAANWVFAVFCSSWPQTDMTNISGQLIGQELVLMAALSAKICLWTAGIQCVGKATRPCAEAQGKVFLTCSSVYLIDAQADLTVCKECKSMSLCRVYRGI